LIGHVMLRVLSRLIGANADAPAASRTCEVAPAREQRIGVSGEKAGGQHLQLDSALNNMSQGLVMFDKDLRLVVANRRYAEMYKLPPDFAARGWTLQDVVRRHFATGVLSGDAEAYIEQIMRGMRSLGSNEALTRIVRTADGRVISVIHRELEGGGRIATHEDITERHYLQEAHAQTEEQLREQKLQLDAALNNMSQGLCMFDAASRVVVCNRRFLEMHKLSADVVKPGCPLLEVLRHRKAVGLLNADPEKMAAEILQDVARGEARTWIVPATDGRMIRVVNQPMPGGGWVTTHEDITEHKQAEDQIREQKLRLDAALDNMSQGLVMFDAQTGLIVWNQRYLQLYGLPAERIRQGMPLKELLELRRQCGTFSRDPQTYIDELRRTLAEGKGFNIIAELDDGRTISVNNQPMPGGGWISTHDDVTERRNAEQRLSEQKLRLDTALQNMTQGLLMLDSESRVELYNQRYLQMYNLTPDMIRPGMPLKELLELRSAMSMFPLDVQQLTAEIQAGMSAGKPVKLVMELADGRTIAVANEPMASGSWVSTHEDITERREAERQLHEQKLQLDTALNNMTQGLNMFDAAGRLVVCNERYREMYRMPPDAAKPGSTVYDLVQARIAAGTFFSVDPEQYATDMLAAMQRRDPTSATMELTDGRIIAVISRPTPDGSGWVVTHEDITERRRVEQERDRSQAFASTIIENVPSTIVVKDARDLRYVLINRAGEDYFGISRETMIGQTASDVFGADVSATIAKNDAEILKDGEPQFFDEHPTTTPSGSRRIITTTRLLIRNSQNQPQYLLSVIDDRTHRKRAEAQLAHMAHHDTLTSLPNRSAFNTCLDSTIEASAKDGSSFALMTMDIDRFKEINDVFGHAVGDALLREVGRRLQETVGGAFLARLGGDEFAIIAIDGEQPAGAETLADRIMAAAGEDFLVEGRQLRIGISLGIAIFPVDGSDTTALVANADAALYRAKGEGRGTFRFFEAGMDERLRERRVLQQELRSAIERGELTIHYQPQAKIDGQVIGFEALARWRNPSRGIIPPGTFIPLAEESGLIIPMGEWILREACRQAASWPKLLHIAINLSPVQFRHGDLPALVHSVLLETGLSPSRLELEITEGVLIDDFARAVAILRRLKALGVRIAMDDFGTGYSSLSYLQSFPFDKIKIDQAFISNLESSPQSTTIVRAVIGLARALDVPVVAEGVETKEQLEFLASEHCDEVQGFLIGRPRPIEEYADLTGLPKKKVYAGATG
jgi:diguanylate cyclase (GGDEF)-like protein/PAS domain S-box-containing protein